MERGKFSRQVEVSNRQTATPSKHSKTEQSKNWHGVKTGRKKQAV